MQNKSIESLLRKHDLDTKDFTSSSAYLAVCELCEGLANQVERLQEENEKLKLWKESEIRLWGPLLDYMQKNPFLKPGDSISQKSLEFLKEYTAILERLKQ